MRKYLERVKSLISPKRLDPKKPEDRREIVRQAVRRTVREYDEALKRLGAE